MASVLDQRYELVPVDEVRMHPDNAKRSDVVTIAGSISRNGFYGALVAQRSTGYILVGNHRWLAAKEQGLDELPVLFVDVDADEARRIMVADNRTSELGDFDEAKLLALLQGFDGDLAGTGYTVDDVAKLLTEPEFLPDDTAQSRLDERTPICCPSCGFEWRVGASGTVEPV